MKKCKKCKEPMKFTERNGLKTYFQKFGGFGIDCGCAYEVEKSETTRLKRINKRSSKRIEQENQYKIIRKVFLSRAANQLCPITGKKATTIHHKKGRIGNLLNDTRYWVALSMEGHKFVEENPEWAKENGYSLSRLTNDQD